MKNIMFRFHNVFIRPLLAVFCLFFLLAYSQQDPQITHNMFNRFMYNPAVAGAYPEFHATLLHRNQWVGVDGAPTTSNLNAYAYLSQIQGGVGINVINDKAGMFSAKTVTASYAYQTMLGQKHRLGMGLSFGFMQYGYDGTWVTPDNTADQFLPDANASKSVPDIGLGLYLSHPDYYIGVSATHIVPMEVDFDGVAVYNQARHYYLLGGYDYDLTDDFSLRLNMLTKTDGVSLQTDYNINTFFRDSHWAGISYRYEDALCFLIGFEVANGFTFAYAFDMVTSKLSTQANGSHEVFLRYAFELDFVGRQDTRYSNLRYP